MTNERKQLCWSAHGNGFVADWSRGTAQITHEAQAAGTAKWRIEVFENGELIYNTRQFTRASAERAAEFNIPD